MAYVYIQEGFTAEPPRNASGANFHLNDSGLVARAIRNAIRANQFARIIRNWNPCFYSASGRFARLTRISDSRESPDSRESCESIRANQFARIIRNWNPCFYSASGRFARLTRISDSRESPDSRESCESIRANHATKDSGFGPKVKVTGQKSGLQVKSQS